MEKIRIKKINGVIHVKLKTNKTITYKYDLKKQKILDFKIGSIRIDVNNLSKIYIQTLIDKMTLAMLNEGWT